MFRKNNESWLIVGLGNPGKDYARTRHNCGFRAIDILAQQLGCKIDKSKFQGLYGQVTRDGKKLFLLKPQTYMNLSGEAVIQAARFYKIPPEHIIVVSDEVSLPIGKLRIRKKGSAGGHNGLKNIIQHLGTEEFPRIRIGVGAPPHPDYDMADWVLASFKNQDAADMAEAVKKAAQAVESCIADGIDRAMNKFN